MSRLRNDDAVARLRLAGDGSGNVQSGSPEDLAFQLTDAQFSVIALATPGEPSVVIDRIAYTPYGESTRTLRSDVNGDGFVNKSDYDNTIQPLKGETIGSPGYAVEADLNRDGTISNDDYDICVADDGQSSSGGVGEAGLFSAGVRNSVGYCGYIHNEDTGLYTVRFRTYSATLGRWLTRDPAGYVDGMALYEYGRSTPVTILDPLGLCSSGGHSAKDIAKAIGVDLDEAKRFAEWLEDMHDVNNKVHAGFHELRVLCKSYHEYINKPVPAKVLKDAADSIGKVDLKKMGAYGFSLFMLFLFVEDAQATINDPTHPVRKFWDEARKQAISGKCSEDLLRRLGDNMQDFLTANTLYKPGGWTFGEGVRDRIIQVLIDHCRKAQHLKDKHKCEDQCPKTDDGPVGE